MRPANVWVMPTTPASATSVPGLHWVQTAGALPLPLDMKDVVLALVVRCSDVIQALEQETLQITGLAGRQYLLIIDDQQIGTFNEAQLGEGINLAVLTTPMAKQAATGACFDAKAQQRPRGPLAPRSSGSRGRCAGAQRRGAEESGHVGERTNPAAA